MKERINKSFGFLKTTALGGVLYLFPLVVLGALFGYVFNIVYAVAKPLKDYLPVDTPVGFAVLFLATLGVILLLCFICGLLTRRAFAKQFSQRIEKRLMTVFPKYAIYKDLLAGEIGGDENVPTLTPVTVRLHDCDRIGFETDRLSDGRVAIYLPGAPDTWAGFVALVSAEQVTPLNLPLAEVVGLSERLGRDSASRLSPSQPGG